MLAKDWNDTQRQVLSEEPLLEGPQCRGSHANSRDLAAGKWRHDFLWPQHSCRPALLEYRLIGMLWYVVCVN